MQCDCCFLTLTFIAALFIYVLYKLGVINRLLYKVDTETTQHGGELVANTLKAHNVKQVFTLSGGHISPILCASEKLGIRIVDTRHEVNAVFAADAVARLSGNIGVAAVTAGPGITNTITAVKNAQMAESPILLMGGAAANLLKGRGALQDIDQMSLLKSLCKYTATIRYVRDIPSVLRNAIKEAQSGTPGPVFVEFPLDTLYPYHLIKRELGVKESGPISLVQRVVNAYLMNYIQSLFAGAFDKHEYSPIKPNIVVASDTQIQQAADLLKTAKKPVILIGSQATLPPVPAEKLRESLEKLNAPCFLGGMARGLLGRDNELQFRHCRKDALKEADVVILAGTVADFRLGYGKVLSRKSKIISVNRNKEQLTKNSDMFWKPTLAIQSDPASFIVKLAEATKSKGPEDWLNTLREKDNAKETTNKNKGTTPTNVHLNPLKILQTLENVLPDNAILVADGGDFVATAAYNLRPRSAGSWLDPGAFGTLGVGGGFALGAKLVRPESEVWIIYGDGSCGYSIAEIDTFTRHNTPVISIVGNDAGWTQIARDQVVFFGSTVACDLAYTDYDVVAKGYGGVGIKMDRSNDSNIEELLQKAREEHANGKSVLINALIGKTDFRDGSLSV